MVKLRGLSRDSITIIEVREYGSSYMYDFVSCDIMIYLIGIYDVFGI